MINKMDKCTSLTTPGDSTEKWKCDYSNSELTNEQLKHATEKLNNTDFTERFPQRESRFADEELALQRIGLFSFIPAKGATPNKNGVYGFAKLRGNFDTESEANARAESIIKKTDSTHTIFHTWVGRPFPITNDEKYVKEVEEVNIRKEETISISNSIKKQSEKDKKELQEIEDRQRLLREDVSRGKKKHSEYEDDDEEEDEFTLDDYVTLRVKKAQLHWTYMEQIRKVMELKDLIKNVNKDLIEKNEKYPDMNDKFYDKYMKAREESGFTSVSEEEMKNSFMQYLVEDAYLPGINVDSEFMNVVTSELDKRREGNSYVSK